MCWCGDLVVAKGLCRKHYHQAWLEANPDAAQRRNKRARENTLWLRTLKDVPCHDCGNRFPPYVMDFDHREGEEKLFQIGRQSGRCRSALEAELKKCDIVCANCHRVRTYFRQYGTLEWKEGREIATKIQPANY